MSKITPHNLLDNEDIQNNKDDLMSYANMRDEMIKVVSKARGQKRIYLKQVLDVLDLVAENALHGYGSDERDAEIYSILS